VATIVASAGLATSDGIGGKGPGARRAGTRAALMLADRGDPRCIAPLVRVFSTGGFLQNKYQDQIEAALTKFLTHEGDRPEVARFAPDIRLLADRLRQGGERGDLSPGRADLLIAILRCLEPLGGPENLALLRAIAGSASGSPARQPQRARVKATAEELLASAAAR
jgi:hypothetical protein